MRVGVLDDLPGADDVRVARDGQVYVFVLSSMWPWLVPAQANARLGSVSVGAEQNHASHTA
jgi:hypothetical protein